MDIYANKTQRKESLSNSKSGKSKAQLFVRIKDGLEDVSIGFVIRVNRSFNQRYADEFKASLEKEKEKI